MVRERRRGKEMRITKDEEDVQEEEEEKEEDVKGEKYKKE